MTSSKYRIFRLDLAPLRGLPVMGQMIFERKVLRIECETVKERRSVDVSPLPFLHRETLDDVLGAAKSFCTGQVLNRIPVSLETALGFLQMSAEPQKPSGEFQNTALISLDQFALESLHPELRVCKIKMGRMPLHEVRQRLEDLLSSRPNLRLRLDFNQAFSEVDLTDVQNLIRDFPIDYLEEPTKDINQLKALARICPIGLDENLGRDEELDRLAAAWVIKPNVLGFAETQRRFRDPSPVKKVLSNVFESDATLRLYAHTYASSVDSTSAVGFGTASYFPRVDTESLDWDPRVLRGDWPDSAFGEMKARGELLWEN